MLQRSNSQLKKIKPSVLILVTFAICHILFIFLIYGNYFLAPDESGYEKTFLNLYKSDFSVGTHGGWGIFLNDNFLYTQILRLFYFFPSILLWLGTESLLAMRLWSLMLTFVCFYLAFTSLKPSSTKQKLAIIAVFFSPTIFTFSSLGLREPFIYLFTTLIVVSLSKCLISDKTIKWYSVFGLSMVGLFVTKPYLYNTLFLSLIFALFFAIIARSDTGEKKIVIKLVIFGAVPILLFPSAQFQVAKSSIDFAKRSLSISSGANPTPNPTSNLTPNLTPNPTSNPTPNPTPNPTSKPNLEEISSYTTHLLKLELNESIDSINPIKKFLLLNLLESSESYDGSTAINKAQKSAEFTGLDKVRWVITSPNPFEKNASLILKLLSVETLFFWLLLIVYFATVFTGILQRRIPIHLGIFFFSWFLLSLLSMAFLDTNEGTLIRHRSPLVLALLLITILCQNLRELRSNQQPIKARGDV
jgi:hypothetical protein